MQSVGEGAEGGGGGAAGTCAPALSKVGDTGGFVPPQLLDRTSVLLFHIL